MEAPQFPPNAAAMAQYQQRHEARHTTARRHPGPVTTNGICAILVHGVPMVPPLVVVQLLSMVRGKDNEGVVSVPFAFQ